MTSTPKVTEGEAPFSWPAANKPLTTYYKITGDLSTSTRPPLIVLHGGPGISHIYLTPFADLAAAHGIPVILYDQIGNGRSTHLRERAGDGAFWTDALFVAQLDALIAALGVAEYDLAGHSWGGMLAARFAVRRPQGLRRLVIASSPADMHTWVKVQNELLKEMPEDVQESLRKHEAAGTTDTEEYKAAVEKFYARHLCRLNPLPDDVQAVEKVIEDDPTVYLTMNGPSEFHVIGTIKAWTVVDELYKINVPTLLTNGRYDEAQDEAVLPYFLHIPKIKWVQMAESSHMPHWEERERFVRVLGDFLTS